MVKSFRFLLQFTWINLGALLVFALVVTVGSLLTGVPGGADNLFSSYFSAFPLMALMILYIYAFALCTSCLNLALSFGATRRGFFWAVQGILLVYTFVSWLLQGVLAALPSLFHWAFPERFPILRMCGFSSWSFPLLCLVILCLGCLAGLVFIKSKAAGVLVVTLSGAAGIVVSNHGGRVLGQTRATADVLPDIAAAVGGKCVIFVDGGIRTGVDVFKALALGADAVLIGRPFVPAVYGGEAEGAKLLFAKLKAELVDTMTMCGAHTLAEITREKVYIEK